MIKKNLDLIIVTFIMMSIIMYDVTLDIIEESLHLLLEVLHNLFEWVELGVEKLVDRLFDELEIGETVAYLFTTERHASQVFTFYILISIIAYGLFRISKFAPNIYHYLRRLVLMSWIRRKTQFQLYWHSLSQLHKVALFATAVSVLLLSSLLII